MVNFEGFYTILAALPVFIAGALKGVIIGGLIYTAMAAVTGNASKAGFLKTVLTSFVTGGIGSGLGELNVFGNGFWGKVAQGAAIGGAGGAVDALLNQRNILQGILKGAAIGATVATVSQVADYYVNGKYKPQYTTTEDVSVDGATETADANTMNQNIKNARANLPDNGRFKLKSEGVGISDSNGMMYSRHFQPNVLGVTYQTLGGKNIIYYSVKAASNPLLLGRVMSHESAHALSNVLGIPNILSNKAMETMDDAALNTVNHIAMRKLELEYAAKNLIFPTRANGYLPNNVINTAISSLGPKETFFYHYIYNLLKPLFNIKYNFPSK